ncbi:MAG: exo-beta-N-acetylmuramidase NamZ domain-containing protein [Terriglobales bacterium]
MNKAVETATPPGAVVIVGHNGKIVYRKAFGWRSLEPQREKMTLDTIFDMASCTKPVATAMSVMRLVQLGQIRLNDPVAKYIPEFAVSGKQDITIRQLLTHYSGLREDLDLKEPWQGKDTAFRLAMEEKPVYPPGMRFLYSDINYIVLGFLVERVSGMPLDKYAQVHFFGPLGMKQTRFVPPATWRPRIAPTQYDENHVMLRGVVHDPTARRMGGVAGHAGMFSTAADMAKLAQALLDNEGKVLDPLVVEKMTTPQQPPTATGVRGFGWDIDSPFASNRGDLLPVGSFGHTGFTGTSIWIDPTTKTYIIVLANGVHPTGGKALVALRSQVATAVTAALKLDPGKNEKLRLARITGYNEAANAARRIPFRNGQVKTGIDVLAARNFDVLQGAEGRKKRIGLLTNHTGVDAQGRRTIDVLAHAPGIELVAIFSPEHGVGGQLDTENIADSKDEATGVPVYSVYGDTDAKRRPPLDVLKSLNAVVYDIHDIGVRFYTYETTLGYLLEAAAKTGTKVIVLDRPNPITGSYVQGPLSDAGRSTFVDYHPVPLRHGMTIGELAKFYNAERNINAKLTVVPMEGWQRGDWYDSTGLAWVNPSPNMRSLTQATLYSGVGLIEGTNISVGRGTDTPFEVVGAPWVNARELATYLNERGIGGVRFVPITFTPNASKYANERCGGVNIVVIDRNALDAPLLGLELASALHRLYPAEYKLDRMIELLGNQAVFEAIGRGEDPRRIEENYRDAVLQFQNARKKYLIY